MRIEALYANKGKSFFCYKKTVFADKNNARTINIYLK